MFPYIYSCVEAKQGHVRLVKGLLIPFSFLPSASYPVYAFWSFYSSVVDLKAHSSALWLNRRLYGVVVYEGTSKVVGFVGLSALFHVVEEKFFTPHGFIPLATYTTSTLSQILGKHLLKPKRAHIYTKCAKAHGSSSQHIISFFAHDPSS